jgi:sugar lactone lactonase YvrE
MARRSGSSTVMSVRRAGSDQNTLLVATETDLVRFDLETGAQERVAPLEAGNPATRSNDGRADPFGGFWIGTMGKKCGGGGRGALSLLPGRGR